MKTQMQTCKQLFNRRDFLLQSAIASGGLLTMTSCSTPRTGGKRLFWTRSGGGFVAVTGDGRPLTSTQKLLDASVRLAEELSAPATLLSASQSVCQTAALRTELRHELRDNGRGEDVLEATLTISNTSAQALRIELAFSTSAQPASTIDAQRVYLPLSAAGLLRDGRFSALGMPTFLKDCDQLVGAKDFAAHYLEPMASHPAERETRALLLAPVVDIFEPQHAWHVALFTQSDQPMRFSHRDGVWYVGREVTVPAGAQIVERCWLMPHTGDASEAWQAFHRLAHQEPFIVPDWVRAMRVHYYDFLSSAQGGNGHRGDGYEADLPLFRDFHVGLATQHGYYPCMGDYMRPDRTTWLAMQGSKYGAAPMSIDRLKERIRATRATGAKAGIYMHLTALDDSSPFYPPLAEGRKIGADGKPIKFDWNGPDVKGGLWWMSMAAPEWRQHLLQQAQWIMEVLKPDAITMDETFSGLGYDENPKHRGALSPYAIDFFKKMRALVHSYGPDKAFLGSDCSMSGFVLWADGECGDHAYNGLLGHPLYAQEPVRYLAALGNKPWRPCSWDFQRMWEAQMKLARQVGAGVGVSNGWIQYTGLARLAEAPRQKMTTDIRSLF